MFIKDFIDVPKQSGEVGIEIEVEGENLPYSVKGWDRTDDGSLRGECCEFVLEKPCPRNKVGDMLDKVYSAYHLADSTIHPSTRQSVHIHINVQEMTITQIYTYILTFIIFEGLLVDYCGDGRTGNLFCLRARDAEYSINNLSRSSNRRGFYNLDTDTLRYSAVNVASLFKYGSLEFRSMRGGTDQEEVEVWIDLLLSIKDYAKSVESPKAMAMDYRDSSVEDFTRKIFGPLSKYICSKGYESSIREGARLIKMVAYTGKWDELSEEVKKEKEVKTSLSEIERLSSIIDDLTLASSDDLRAPSDQSFLFPSLNYTVHRSRDVTIDDSDEQIELS